MKNTISNEVERLAAAQRLRAIRVEMGQLDAQMVAYNPRDAAHRTAMQLTLVKRTALDQEQRDLEISLRAYRDPKLTAFIREVRAFVDSEGAKHKLPNLGGDSGTGHENAYEAAIEKNQFQGLNTVNSKTLEDRLTAYRKWEREGYQECERICARAVAGIFRDEDLTVTLRSCARDFENVRAAFRAPSLVESLLEVVR